MRRTRCFMTSWPAPGLSEKEVRWQFAGGLASALGPECLSIHECGPTHVSWGRTVESWLGGASQELFLDSDRCLSGSEARMPGAQVRDGESDESALLAWRVSYPMEGPGQGLQSLEIAWSSSDPMVFEGLTRDFCFLYFIAFIYHIPYRYDLMIPFHFHTALIAVQ